MEKEIKDAEVLSASPTPKTEVKIPVVEEKDKPATYDFVAAISRVIFGAKITREDWDDKETYGHLADGFLMLRKEDGKNYQWIVSEADMKAEDWILL